MKRIEVWADVVCSWAHIGKRRLEKAEFGEDVEVVWRPYLLDPAAPAPSGTFDAHRVLALALERGGPELQNTLVERIMNAYFVDGADIGDRAVLAALAAESGLDGMAEALDAGEGTDEVHDQLLRGKAIGVTTSPTFVVGESAIAGAQPPEVLADLVRHAVPARELPDEVTRLRHAESLLEARDPLGALRLMGPLLAEHGDDPSVRLLAARAYFGSAQLGRARETLESLLERTPGDHYVRFLLGRTLQRSNRLPEALPHLRMAAAMSSDPDYADALRRAESEVS
ncbi:DsbA family protein [Streptosporangium lutulentum]|uniref:DsbA family dithiol-disulfide isomerase n=1 Tax=Streptosporangium lutulentum TaxID=1461250 RepID=A0ABT9QJN1_9ACTN|nr:DsbA family protein [Streptosporangium lutulentum]MDP9846956.1 putative DsbA family dithiol-disulfide isomerase [Streptosporangium lutulentum]